MKFVYVMILIAVVAALLTNDTVKAFLSSTPEQDAAAREERTSGRLQEAEGASTLGAEVAR